MNLELAGKVALVTGSSRGIGREIAATLATEGCRVIINGRDPLLLTETATQLGASAVAGDVTEAAGAREVLRQADSLHEQLDILVCNVGSGASVPPGREDATEWQRMLQLNLLAATNTVEAAQPYLSSKGGVILCISSICGHAALGAPIAYSAAKAALNSFVRGAARHLGQHNIRINALSPGNILFAGSTWERKLAETPAEVHAMLAREIALGRLGTPEEVAGMATFLCSPRAAFVTGGIFVVDGGQLRA